MIHCCVWGVGGRYYSSTWQCPFCLTHYTFHLESESWDVRYESVPDVEQDAWLFFVLEDVIKHYTQAAAMSHEHIVKYAYFSSSSLISTLWNTAACTLHIYGISFAFEADSRWIFSSSLPLPIWYLSLFIQQSLSTFDWSEARSSPLSSCLPLSLFISHSSLRLPTPLRP